MSDTCKWSDCRRPYDIVYSLGSKSVQLCDKHNNLVSHTRNSTRAQARKAVGLPMPKTLGRMLRRDEQGLRCCVLSCYRPAALIRSGPVCNDHVHCDMSSTKLEEDKYMAFIPGRREEAVTRAERTHCTSRTASDAVDYGDLFDTDLYFED